MVAEDGAPRALAVRDVRRSFGDIAVLRGVDLDVPAGTTVALLGPSGSGKSTLLRIVAGLERSDAGTVHLGEDDVSDRPPHRRGVGVVFQDQALFPHLDVGGNVGFGLRMAGVGSAERARRVAEVLDVVGLPGTEGRDPSTLSGGEAQRVALARALAARPGVLLLDEPLAALDQVLRERLLLELAELFATLAVTVVTVTHDPTEAATLGDRIAVLLDGRIAQLDAAGTVLAAPCSAVVAGLVGHRNVGRGEVVAGGVDTPWGRIADVDGGGRGPGVVDVLVRPDAVSPVADRGPTAGDDGHVLDGEVRGRLFRGGSAFAVVSGETWPALDVRADPSWRTGGRVRVSIDPGGVHVMDRPGA